MSLISLAISLILLMDPLGDMPVFLTHLKNIPVKRQRRIILRELLIALFVILVFMFIGQPLLKLIEIKQHTVFISGGIILFIIALKMIFPSEHPPKTTMRFKEPFIVPLAIPLIAGPAILAAVIIYAAQVPTLYTLFLAIVIAWIITTIILLSAPTLSKILRPRGITACERLMGLILTLIAIQMFFNGIQQFISMSTIANLTP